MHQINQESIGLVIFVMTFIGLAFYALRLATRKPRKGD